VRLEIPPVSGGRFRGNVLLRVLARQSAEDGSVVDVGSATAGFLVTVRQNLAVALRPIRRGEAVDASNAGLSKLDTTFLAEDGYASLDDLAGLKAKTYIGQGKLISPAMLERPPLVHRGDIVKLVVRSGLISVQASAKALRDGALGDSLPVELLDSKKQVQGRVLDAGTVVSDSR
jgi:flagella basal body P-ring formation protein FlgA